jgi:tRNA A37 threonylcarbamoyltransferase TsaD
MSMPSRRQAGPGLIGGLIVGLMTGKAHRAVRRASLSTPVNHLEGHALTARLTMTGCPFPI